MSAPDRQTAFRNRVADEDQRELIDQIERGLRPGGTRYGSDMPRPGDERNRERYDRFAARYGRHGVFALPEKVVVRHHAREWIAELLAAFPCVEYETIEVRTMNDNPARGFQYLGRKPRA